ncbi:MAG TPA: hypothetical protein VJS64_18965 [Pyrinomonadaceae bacterium]|nr:hypothetical protein [Pyrinomonadaceae bacterium]
MSNSAPCKCPTYDKKNPGSCTCAPPERKYEKPVSWLLGRQLIASLKSTLLYTAFGTKIDARDWMDAKVFPSAKVVRNTGNSDAANVAAVLSPEQEVAKAWEGIYERESPADFIGDKGEFWFDYISDTGDGMTATYSVAYLCLNNLWIKDPGTQMPPVKVTQEEIEENQLPQEWLVRMETKGENLDGLKKLPRGEFLMVGGDTSYHMADYASLHLRFQKPFEWAYDDLRKHLSLKPFTQLSDAEKTAETKRFRPIFGIPGNHDYYDMLDGFRRQFREPTSSRSETEFQSDVSKSAQLQIHGFRRYQETSYIALRLPFDWMIWGLDTEVGKIDERQRDFFKSLKKNGENPKKLIVCTSAPTTVFGKFADKDDEKSAKAFWQLRLPRPFLRSENETVPASEVKEEPPPAETKLNDDEIRLDLAGDVHHYARYWGPASPNTQPTRHYFSPKRPLAKTNYASVMSGLGGAFHHPSTTSVDEIREQALYPDEDSSRKQVAGQIFNPWRVVKGGGVWFVGGLVALILAFAAIADRSTRPAIHNFKPFIGLGITQPEQYQSTVDSPAEAKRHQSRIQHTVLTKVLLDLGVTKSWTPTSPTDPNCDTTNAPLFLWGRCRTQWPAEYAWGFWLFISTVPLMGIGFLLMGRHYREWRDLQEKRARGIAIPEEKDRAHQKAVKVSIWGFTLGMTLLALIAVLIVMPYRTFITPFGNSLVVLLTFCWAAFAIYLSLKYSDWLFEQASLRAIRRRDWAITWVLAACAFFAVAIGLWVFGKANPAAYLVADIVSVLVVIGAPVILLLAGLKVGGVHQKGLGKVGMALIGAWHGLLQIGVAVFLIKKGTWLTLLVSIALVVIFMFIGKALMQRNQRAMLTIAFVVYGALMLVLPPLIYYALLKYRHVLPPGLYSSFFFPHSVDSLASFSTYEWWSEWRGWWQLIPIFLGGIFGAFLSCVWLGWYFGVCLGFHGHNNEAGGAARIEKFKQMVRFRLTKDTLTGYVIGVRDPQRCGKCLHPYLIDIFQLTKAKGS